MTFLKITSTTIKHRSHHQHPGSGVCCVRDGLRKAVLGMLYQACRVRSDVADALGREPLRGLLRDVMEGEWGVAAMLGVGVVVRRTEMVVTSFP
jgi:hypothetical protein